MIKYALKCSEDHLFDGWFGSSAAFDKQKEMGLVTCPYCGTDEVEKTLMAPSVTGTKMQGESVDAGGENTDGEAAASAPVPVPSPASTVSEVDIIPATIPEPLVHGDDTMRAVIDKMRELRTWVEDNAVNVGDKFAEKAREIHYGEEDAHGIFGKATFEEAQELIDEGVDFMPLPALPEDNN